MSPLIDYHDFLDKSRERGLLYVSTIIGWNPITLRFTEVCGLLLGIYPELLPVYGIMSQGFE